MKKIVSGITPTGELTLGHYFIIKELVKKQNEFEIYSFVADYHALTNPNEINRETLLDNSKKIVALYLALGLGKKNSKIYIQSSLPIHLELAYLIACHSSYGELNRMTQFKHKSYESMMNYKRKQIENIDNKKPMDHELIKGVFVAAGLFIYPTLMASDILIYQSDYVLVGNDQKQHIELTRNIAERMNNKYSQNEKEKIFKIPKYLTLEIGERINSLTYPTEKMSKSSKNRDDNIYILDDPKEIERKIKKALTDNEDKVKYD